MSLANAFPSIHAILEQVPSAQLWDLVPSVVGGVIGALAGGLPAYLISARQSNEAKTERRRVKEQNDLAQIYAAHAMLEEIVNGLFSICLQWNEQLQLAHTRGDKKAPLWAVLTAMLGMGNSQKLRFSSDFVGLLMEAGEHEFASKLILIARRYDALMDGVRDYSIRREKLAELMPTDKFEEGTVGSVTLEGKSAAIAITHIKSLEPLIEYLFKTVHDDRRAAMVAAEEFGPAMKRVMPRKKVPSFTVRN